MYNNKRKAKPLTRIKHSKFIDEDPNIDDICTRIQSTCMKTSTVDNLNYERENTTTPIPYQHINTVSTSSIKFLSM